MVFRVFSVSQVDSRGTRGKNIRRSVSGDQPPVLEVTSDDDLSPDIIFGHLSPREGPSLTQTFPHL